MSDTVYPVGGGFEDWAYGAGIDFGTTGGALNCYPVTYSLAEDGIEFADGE